MSTTDEHEHYWRHATVMDARGAGHAGRRCDCGMETIGLLNAELIRGSQALEDALRAAMVNVGRVMEAERRRRFEP